jgi:serpin B
VAAVAIVAAAVAGCAGRTPPPALLRAENVSRVIPPANAPVSTVVAGMTQLGYRLGQTATGNWIISPASIAYAFAMVRVGARGATADEIDKAFGFPATGRDEAFNAITRAIVTADVPPPPDRNPPGPGDPPRPSVVCLGNALFPESGYQIGADFLHTLAEQFGTGVYPVDFNQDAAVKAINALVNQQTAGRIPSAVQKVAKDTLFVLANTVYLRADWRSPFTKSATSDQAFHRADSSTVTTPMMHNEEFFGYAEGPGWQAVELPYGDGQLVMRVLVPAAGGDPNALLALDPTFTTRNVRLSMPSWDFSSSLDLDPALRALGVRTAFTDGADLSGIGPGLHINMAVHRATITVDENGTEAAAGTLVGGAPTSVPPPPVAVTADHPFAIAIVHKATGVPLFVGHVADPSAHT